MQGILPPIDFVGERAYQCVECDFTVPIADAIAGGPVEFLVVRRGRRAERVMTIGGNEVHRCASLFLVATC